MLELWSTYQANESQVSDVYVHVGTEFNATVTAFAYYSIDMRYVAIYSQIQLKVDFIFYWQRALLYSTGASRRTRELFERRCFATGARKVYAPGATDPIQPAARAT